MSKDRLLALAGGAASALLYLAVLGGPFTASLLTFFAQLPLFLTGFSLGLVSLLIAVAVATLLVGVATVPLLALYFAFMTVIPVLIVVRFALQSRQGNDGRLVWYPPGWILAWLSVVGVVALICAGLYFAGVDGGLEGVVIAWLSKVAAWIAENVKDGPESFLEQAQKIVLVLAKGFPGALATGATTLAMLNAVIGQWLAVRLGRNIRPSPRYSEIDLPDWLGIAAVAVAVTSFLSGQIGYVAQNALIVLLAPFFFVGLAVIHTITMGRLGRRILLGLLYLLLLNFSWLAAPIAGLGLFERFLGLRRRFGRPGPDQEEE